MTQLLITVGIMISFFFGLIIPDITDDNREDWRITEWWRFMFGFPFVLVAVQLILLLTVFPYDTPKVLKQTDQHATLHELMGKIYKPNQVQRRIDEILVEERNVASPSYGETFCSPKYRMATFVGCALSAF